MQTLPVPFFEPLPAPPPEPVPEQSTGWRPPVWDRPSEALLGAPVDVAILLGRNERMAVALDTVRAYPNGFDFTLALLRNPHLPRDPMGHPFMGMGHPRGPRGPRVGFEFSNGTQVRVGGPSTMGFPAAGAMTQLTVARGPGPGPGPRNPFGYAVDDNGVPVDPVLIPRGGGGSDERYEIRFWCFPLPPPGPTTVFAEWFDEGIDESATVIDADEILAAVPRVVTLWETAL
jgi:hypothetical protein